MSLRREGGIIKRFMCIFLNLNHYYATENKSRKIKKASIISLLLLLSHITSR